MSVRNAHGAGGGKKGGEGSKFPRTCGGCGKITYVNPTPVAVCVLPTDEGVLTIRRGIEPRKGQIALPGGFIDNSEQWRDACAREVFEETGITVNADAITLFDVHSAPDGTLLVFGLAICLLYAWGAHLAGLAPAIGAFLAGLVIVPEDYRPLVQRPGDTLEGLVAPLLAFFVPVFFLLSGLQVELRAFLDPHVWLLSAAFVIAAVIGKLSAGLGAAKGSSRLVVGLSMIPRGEVSLIFATAGMSLVEGSEPLVAATTFNALVITVIATALVPPLALRRAFARSERDEAARPAVDPDRPVGAALGARASPEPGRSAP